MVFLWICLEVTDLCHERRFSLLKKTGEEADIYYVKYLDNW